MCVYDERRARCKSPDISPDIPMWLKNGVSSHSYIGHCLPQVSVARLFYIDCVAGRSDTHAMSRKLMPLVNNLISNGLNVLVYVFIQLL